MLACCVGLAACAADPPELPGVSTTTASTGAATSDTTGAPGPADSSSTFGGGTTAATSTSGVGTDTGADSSTGEPSTVVCEGPDGLCHTPLPLVPVPVSRVDSIGLGDFDEDGTLDVAVGDDLFNRVVLVRGDGTGMFSELGSTNTGGGNLDHLTVVDIDGDGHLDVVTANGGDDSISVMLGDGTGALTVSQTLGTFGSPRALAAADLDGDGAMDLVVGVGGTPGVEVMYGPGLLPTEFFSLPGAAYEDVRLGQLGPDTQLDLIAGTRAGDRVSVVPGAASGGFTVGGLQEFGGNQAVAGHLEDIDGDGLVDLVAVSDGAAWFHPGTVAGQLAPNEAAEFFLTLGLRDAAFGDLNADGRTEVVVVSNETDDIRVLVGEEVSLFAPVLDFPYGENLWDVELGDINGDGALDVVAGARNGNALAILISSATRVLRARPEVNDR